MSKLWEFFSGGEIDDSELPAQDVRREPSPEERSAWEAMVNFFTGHEVDDSELPAPEDRLIVVDNVAASPPTKAASASKAKAAAPEETPARTVSGSSAKRQRDDSAVNSEIEEKLVSNSAAKLSKDASLTRQELAEYLERKGTPVTSSQKKADLVKLAIQAASESQLTTATPTPEAPAAVEEVVFVAPVEEVVFVAPVEEDDEKPSLKWTIKRLRDFAQAKGITYAADALKNDIYDAIVEATNGSSPPRRSSSGAKRASLSRSASKKN